MLAIVDLFQNRACSPSLPIMNTTLRQPSSSASPWKSRALRPRQIRPHSPASVLPAGAVRPSRNHSAYSAGDSRISSTSSAEIARISLTSSAETVHTVLDGSGECSPSAGGADPNREGRSAKHLGLLSTEALDSLDRSWSSRARCSRLKASQM